MQAGVERADPYAEIDLHALVRDPHGRERRVPAFWRGGDRWSFRYASPLPGVHIYRTRCSDASDTGLHDRQGEIEVVPYEGDNPLYRHGPLRDSAGHPCLEHADGTPFPWLGDAWWMGLTKRLTWPDDFQLADHGPRAQGIHPHPDRRRAVSGPAAVRPARRERGGTPVDARRGGRLRARNAEPGLVGPGRRAHRPPGLVGAGAVPGGLLGLLPGALRRGVDPPPLGLPDRPLRRLAGGLVSGRRGDRPLLHHRRRLGSGSGRSRRGRAARGVDSPAASRARGRPVRAAAHHPSHLLRRPHGGRAGPAGREHAADRPLRIPHAVDQRRHDRGSGRARAAPAGGHIRGVLRRHPRDLLRRRATVHVLVVDPERRLRVHLRRQRAVAGDHAR